MIQEIDKIVKIKQKEKSFLRYLIAGFLTLFVHSSLFCFVENSKVNKGTKTRVRFVSLLPINSKLQYDVNLQKWLAILNPEIVVKPNRKFGFSVSPSDSIPEDIKINLKEYFFSISKSEFIPLPVPMESKKDRMKQLWTYSTASVPPLLFKVYVHKDEDFPLFFRENGDEMPRIISNLNFKAVLKKSEENITETVLKYQFNDEEVFPRIKIIHSSGNANLDRLAVKELLLKGRLAFKRLPSKFSELITIKWMKE